MAVPHRWAAQCVGASAAGACHRETTWPGDRAGCQHVRRPPRWRARQLPGLQPETAIESIRSTTYVQLHFCGSERGWWGRFERRAARANRSRKWGTGRGAKGPLSAATSRAQDGRAKLGLCFVAGRRAATAAGRSRWYLGMSFAKFELELFLRPDERASSTHADSDSERSNDM